MFNIQDNTTEDIDIADLIMTTRLTRDLKKAAMKLSDDQSRYLVDLYYRLQKLRIGASAQVRSMDKIEAPNTLIIWTKDMYAQLETDVKSALEVYAKSVVPGRWALSQKGIGPVIAAGLLAHIDITKTPTAGALWRFAGLDPTVKWNKSEKRPWNARLKTLTWKISESFVKTSNRESAFYGEWYKKRKLYETEQNTQKAYANQAEEGMKRVGEDTEAYKWYSMGMLPPAHIQSRVQRWTAKLFLSHMHAVMFETYYNRSAPRPYAIQFLGHVHEIAIPGWPMVE